MAWHVSRQDLESFVNLEPRRAQEILPELVGKLIKATIDPKFFRFPKGHDIYLPGFDGELDSEVQTEHIPLGRSVWQVSVRHDFWKKANEDFDGKNPISDGTYIQLFIHEWQSRNGTSDQDWIDSVKNRGWKEVRVISGTQLIDWIEACPAVHRWLATILNKRSVDHVDVEEGWKIWSNETRVPCNKDLIISDRVFHAQSLQGALLNAPCSITILGDSISDSAAFVYCAISQNDLLSSRFLDVRRSQSLFEIFTSSTKLILLVAAHTDDVGYAIRVKNHHIIYLQGKTDNYNANISIKLNAISFSSRQSALIKMGYKSDHAYTIVEQCSNNIDFIRVHPDLGPDNVSKFEWMKLPEFSNLLKAFTIINYLRMTSEDEVALLGKVSNIDVEFIKGIIAKLETYENNPIRVSYDVINVESPIILWPLFNKSYYSGSELMFIYADIFGLTIPRYHDQTESQKYNVSSEFKEKAIDALRMVSFKLSTQAELIDANISQIDYIVALILETTHLGLIKRYLIGLSEIAPKIMLDFVENKCDNGDLNDVVETLNGNDFVLFTALEMIGQHSMHLPQVSKLLWRIAQSHTYENTYVRAINSLANLHLPQSAQTSASQSDREQIVKQLLGGNDERTWRLLLALLPSNSARYRFPPYTPKWKDWLRDRIKPSNQEILRYINELVEIAIVKTNENPRGRWIDLIRILPLLPDESFSSCIEHLTVFLSTEENADHVLHQIIKSELRSLINIYSDRKNKRGLLQPEKMGSLESLIDINNGTSESDKCFYILTDWHPSVEVIDEAMTHNEKKEFLENERLRCLGRVYAIEGVAGLESIIGLAKNPSSLMFAFDKFTEFKTIENILNWLSSQNIELERIAGQLITWTTNRDAQWLIENLEIISSLNEDNLIKLLSYSVLSETLLKIVIDKPQIKDRFWTERYSFYITENNSEIVNEVIENLLSYNRLHACIDCLNTVINYNKVSVDPELVLRVLSYDLYNDASYGRNSSMVLNGSWINDLIEWLRTNSIDDPTMIQIEWGHFESIESNHSIPGVTLNKMVSDPVYFVKMFVERSDEISKSTEVWEQVRKGSRLTNLYALLNGFEGTESLLLDEESLKVFVKSAMDNAEQANVGEKIGEKIGRLLSHSPSDPHDGLWPSMAVRIVLEGAYPKSLQNGFVYGIISPDTIGVRYISDDMDQFKEEIIKYTTAAEKLRIRWPNTSSSLNIIANYYQQRNSEFNQRFL